MEMNKWIAIGKVEATPQISMNGSVKQAFFNFIVNNRAPNASGQWVDNPISVPVYARDKKADLIEKYVVAGQELTIEAQYMNWNANGQLQHAFLILNVSFGFKPKGSAPQQAEVTGPPM